MLFLHFNLINAFMYVLALHTSPPMSVIMPSWLFLPAAEQVRAGRDSEAAAAAQGSHRRHRGQRWGGGEDWWGTESWILAPLTVIDTWRLVGEKVYLGLDGGL